MMSVNFLKYSIAMIVVFVLVGSVCLLPHFVGAATPTMKSVLTQAGAGLGETASKSDLPTVIGGYVKLFLGITGIILVIIIVYAGFLWMTAGGNKEQVQKAKDWMINAVVGMLILLSAYAITGFVIDKLTTAGGASTTSGTTPPAYTQPDYNQGVNLCHESCSRVFSTGTPEEANCIANCDSD